MAIGLKFAQRKKKIQSSDHVVRLGEDRMALVDHGIRSRALFREVDDRFGLKTLDHRGQEFVVGDVPDVGVDGITGNLLPNLEPFTQRGDWSERLGAQFMIPLAPDKIIDDSHRVALLRQIKSRSPTAVTVAPEDCYLHVSLPSCFRRVRCSPPAGKCNKILRVPRVTSLNSIESKSNLSSARHQA